VQNVLLANVPSLSALSPQTDWDGEGRDVLHLQHQLAAQPRGALVLCQCRRNTAASERWRQDLPWLSARNPTQG
jgi:hypothetical protein